ncbi:MAG: hypothetical protein LJE62_08490 [Silicimonas sp.]|jgi:hypothetical protein|nr:hypothetical protein [Silicimonas sp.]
MTKHVLDHPKHRDGTRRSQEFTRIDADEMPRPQTKDLQKRSRKTDDGKRLKAFTEIERNQ